MVVYPEQKVASIQEHILGMYEERFGRDAKNRFASEIDVLEAAKKILRTKAEASPKSRSPKSKERTTTKKTKRRRRHV